VVESEPVVAINVIIISSTIVSSTITHELIVTAVRYADSTTDVGDDTLQSCRRAQSTEYQRR